MRQIRGLAPRLAGGPVPLFVFDAGYSPALLTAALAAVWAAVLVRFRDDRVFFRAPPPPSGRGQPPRHGAAFRCAADGTWGEPDAALVEQDAACGRVEVRCWGGLHGRAVRGPGKGTGRGRGPAQPLVVGWVVRVTLDRTPGQARPLDPLWLWYAGPIPPDPHLLWRAYVHRFDVEHTLRFCKERLGWDRARVRTPEQMDRWTWAVLAAYTQLRLARTLTRQPPPAVGASTATGPLTPWRVLGVLAIWWRCWAPEPVHQNRVGGARGNRKNQLFGPATRFPALKATAARAA